MECLQLFCVPVCLSVRHNMKAFNSNIEKLVLTRTGRGAVFEAVEAAVGRVQPAFTHLSGKTAPMSKMEIKIAGPWEF